MATSLRSMTHWRPTTHRPNTLVTALTRSNKPLPVMRPMAYSGQGLSTHGDRFEAERAESIRTSALNWRHTEPAKPARNNSGRRPDPPDSPHVKESIHIPISRPLGFDEPPLSRSQNGVMNDCQDDDVSEISFTTGIVSNHSDNPRYTVNHAPRVYHNDFDSQSHGLPGYDRSPLRSTTEFRRTVDLAYGASHRGPEWHGESQETHPASRRMHFPPNDGTYDYAARNQNRHGTFREGTRAHLDPYREQSSNNNNVVYDQGGTRPRYGMQSVYLDTSQEERDYQAYLSGRPRPSHLGPVPPNGICYAREEDLGDYGELEHRRYLTDDPRATQDHLPPELESYFPAPRPDCAILQGQKEVIRTHNGETYPGDRYPKTFEHIQRNGSAPYLHEAGSRLQNDRGTAFVQRPRHHLGQGNGSLANSGPQIGSVHARNDNGHKMHAKPTRSKQQNVSTLKLFDPRWWRRPRVAGDHSNLKGSLFAKNRKLDRNVRIRFCSPLVTLALPPPPSFRDMPLDEQFWTKKELGLRRRQDQMDLESNSNARLFDDECAALFEKLQQEADQFYGDYTRPAITEYGEFSMTTEDLQTMLTPNIIMGLAYGYRGVELGGIDGRRERGEVIAEAVRDYHEDSSDHKKKGARRMRLNFEAGLALACEEVSVVDRYWARLIALADELVENSDNQPMQTTI